MASETETAIILRQEFATKLVLLNTTGPGPKQMCEPLRKKSRFESPRGKSRGGLEPGVMKFQQP